MTCHMCSITKSPCSGMSWSSCLAPLQTTLGTMNSRVRVIRNCEPKYVRKDLGHGPLSRVLYLWIRIESGIRGWGWGGDRMWDTAGRKGQQARHLHPLTCERLRCSLLPPT